MAPWQNNGTAVYDRAIALIHGVDQIAVDMARKWGEGRLRLLVDGDLRARFDARCRAWAEDMRCGDLEAVVQGSGRMARAWQALDDAATQAGARPLDPQVWEVATDDGVVIAIARDAASASAVFREGRPVAVYTLEEVARLLRREAGVVTAKLAMPGAEVVATREPRAPDFTDAWDERIGDPLPASMAG